MGSITKARRKAMVRGRTMGLIIFKTAPPRRTAIKATRKKFALPELKFLNLLFITPSVCHSLPIFAKVLKRILKMIKIILDN
jgi:hypothetical protein